MAAFRCRGNPAFLVRYTDALRARSYYHDDIWGYTIYAIREVRYLSSAYIHRSHSQTYKPDIQLFRNYFIASLLLFFLPHHLC